MSGSGPLRVSNSFHDEVFERVEKFSEKNFVIVTSKDDIDGLDQVGSINRNWDKLWNHNARIPILTGIHG